MRFRILSAPTTRLLAALGLGCSFVFTSAAVCQGSADIATQDAAAARKLDSLGFAAYRLEEEAYLQAGEVTRFYSDPEDSQSDRHIFFQTSVHLLTLAVKADSTNASAAYHLGVVLGDQSYQGWGEWSASELRVALRWLALAKRMAIGSYASLRASIDAKVVELTDDVRGSAVR